MEGDMMESPSCSIMIEYRESRVWCGRYGVPWCMFGEYNVARETFLAEMICSGIVM